MKRLRIPLKSFSEKYLSNNNFLRPTEDDWLAKALALFQECAHLPLDSSTSPARDALKLLDTLVEQWPEKGFRLISGLDHENGRTDSPPKERLRLAGHVF